MDEILRLNNNPEIARQKRAEVSRLLMELSPNINSGDIEVISNGDLQSLFQLYDQVFLNNWFKANYRGKLKFSLSRRMTRSAGLTKYPKNTEGIKPEKLTVEICIGVDFFFHYDLAEGEKAVGGIATANSLEALQLVFEHELCHAIEFICFGKSNCSARRFKSIAENLFGHTGEFHSLPTHGEIASQKMGLRPGDTVSFPFKGGRLLGVLYRINKRAVVMVKDKQGRFADNMGNRYAKYYVPVSILEKQC